MRVARGRQCTGTDKKGVPSAVKGTANRKKIWKNEKEVISQFVAGIEEGKRLLQNLDDMPVYTRGSWRKDCRLDGEVC